MTDLPSDRYCCDYSVQVGEQLFGTATRADVWLALEYTLPWRKEAFAESDLSDAIKQRVNAYLAAIPKSRLQLIRQPGHESTAGAAFFVAVADAQQPRLYSFHLDQLEDLLALDVPAVVSGDPAYGGHLSKEPLLLVCANGKRDISCAKHGRAVYESMAKIAGKSVWQTTHIGGHRFAATSVFLPHGLCYGRLRENGVEPLIDDFRGGRLYLHAYRGRSGYDEPVQAADYFLRRATGGIGIFDFRLVSAVKNGDEWTVTFEATSDGSTHSVQLVQYMSDFPILKNSSDAQGAPGPQFRLVKVDGAKALA